ncbi:MAG TPA: S1/P1 nuclease [Blastocatellia bacterium]|nr:S1/P1 nuclease [Blastocatellia bacterium]
MRYLSSVLIFAAIVLLAPQPAQGWNKPGHMVSGAIAYAELKASDPEAVKQVVALLKTLPEYRSKWLPAIRRSPVGLRNHDLYLFMYAARWADDIRETDFHCGNCHFINYPFKPDGQPDSVTTRDPAEVNVESTFEQKMGIIRDANSAAIDKAMALAWVFHLVGDVHQPLHTSALFTTQFPNGDQGGNLIFIRTRANANTTRLHSFWDGLVISSERFPQVRDKANELRSRVSHRRAALRELNERDFHDWSQAESFAAAKIHAYRMGTILGGSDETHGEVLPSNYTFVVRPLAERRMILAGYRLADILKETFD